VSEGGRDHQRVGSRRKHPCECGCLELCDDRDALYRVNRNGTAQRTPWPQTFVRRPIAEGPTLVDERRRRKPKTSSCSIAAIIGQGSDHRTQRKFGGHHFFLAPAGRRRCQRSWSSYQQSCPRTGHLDVRLGNHDHRLCEFILNKKRLGVKCYTTMVARKFLQSWPKLSSWCHRRSRWSQFQLVFQERTGRRVMFLTGGRWHHRVVRKTVTRPQFQYWHVWPRCAAGDKSGTGFEEDRGPPASGQRFDPTKVILDHTADSVVRPTKLRPAPARHGGKAIMPANA